MKSSLVCLRGKGTQLFSINQTRTMIGRAAGCDLCLPERSVSRYHAALELEGEAMWLIDLGSFNGTHVNGELVHGARLLSHRDVISLGVIELMFVDDNDHRPSPAANAVWTTLLQRLRGLKRSRPHAPA